MSQRDATQVAICFGVDNDNGDKLLCIMLGNRERRIVVTTRLIEWSTSQYKSLNAQVLECGTMASSYNVAMSREMSIFVTVSSTALSIERTG